MNPFGNAIRLPKKAKSAHKFYLKLVSLLLAKLLMETIFNHGSDYLRQNTNLRAMILILNFD
jgi:hypothetical protein